MFNQIEVIGNLGHDPEMRYSASGMVVVTFSVAVNETVTKADGARGQLTEWFRCSVFGKQGEACNEHLSKGSRVFIRGRLRHSKYINRANEPACSLEIVADLVRFLDRRGQENGQTDEIPESAGETGIAAAAAAAGHSVETEDLPF